MFIQNEQLILQLKRGEMKCKHLEEQVQSERALNIQQSEQKKILAKKDEDLRGK